MRTLYLLSMVAVLGVFNTGRADDSQEPLNGTVTDQEGEPIEGALLWVTDHSEWEATTDEDGKFQFSDPVPEGVSRLFSKGSGIPAPFFNGRTIHFSVVQPFTPVKVVLYDLSGKIVLRLLDKKLPVERHSVVLPLHRLSTATYIVQLTIGDNRYVRTVIVRENGSFSTARPSAEAVSSLAATAKRSSEPEVIDELNCKKDGYEQLYTDLTSYFGTLELTMRIIDTIPPVITILGGDTVSYAFQDSSNWRKYWDQDSFSVQFEVTDNSGKPIKQPSTNTLINVTQSSFVNFYYYAKDSSSNEAKARRLIVLFDSTVSDTEPPIFTIDPDTVRLIRGEKFFPDSGVTVVDSIDKHIDLKPWILKEDDIETEHDRLKDVIFMDVEGTYTMTYTVMDTHMNKVSATRVIIVEAPE